MSDDPNSAPTVRIVNSANLRTGYCQIPASEFDPAIHVLWSDEQARAPAENIYDLRLRYLEKFGKKPFGGWTAGQIAEKLAE